MHSWAFYPAFLGTFISILGWVYLAVNKHDHTNPRTLSILAAEEGKLGYFRAVIWVCGTLFALTLFLYITPKINAWPFATISAACMILGEMLLGVFPAGGRTIKAHNVLGYAMSIAMACLAFAYALRLHGQYADVEIIFTIAIVILGVLAVSDRRNFIYYELPFIFLSHFSILVAALALR